MVEDFDVASEDDLKGGRVNQPGYFHIWITEQQRNDKNDAMQIGYTVLAGTAKGQEERTATHFFQDPSPSHRDGGKFAKSLKSKLALATGLVAASQLGQKVRLDWSQIVGKQAIVKVKINEKGFAEIDGAEIYSVLDPSVGHVPKNAQGLALLTGAPSVPTQQVAQPAAPAQVVQPAAALPLGGVPSSPAPQVAPSAAAPAAAGDPWAAAGF